MSYDVSFRAKLEGVDQWVPVGEDYINHTSNTAAMIKEVCGSYPSEWNGKRCSELLPALTAAVKELQFNAERYRQFEPSNKWGSVESTLKFLDRIRVCCEAFPTAIIDVSY